MATMRRFAALAIPVLLVALLPVVADSAQASGSRLDDITVDGQVVVTVAKGVPAVGDGPAIRRYHDLGRFDADRATVARAASVRLADIVSSTCLEGPDQCRAMRVAMIVDVDDTLLDWYRPYARANFTPSGAVRQSAVHTCATNEAKRLGVAVLVVSGRREPVRSATVSCLKRRGVSEWDALVLRSDAQDDLSAALYKQQAFDALRAEGWLVALNIGDQRADLTGETTTSRYLLPNPLYRTR